MSRSDAILHMQAALAATARARLELSRAIETVGDGNRACSLGFVKRRAIELEESVARSLSELTELYRGADL